MSKLGYKATRTTIVLALHSKYLTTIQDNAVLTALSNAVGVNYDLERMQNEDLEAIYGHFDEQTTRHVLGEYVYNTSLGNVRDNGTTCASCSLCGKGDSRDDGANADHIRYEFRLTNTAGGEEVWCGSTCIINHALKVSGAETNAEARRLLEKSFRAHLVHFRREEWRRDNPDHTTIPELYEEGRRTRVQRFYRFEHEVALLGYSVPELLRLSQTVYGYGYARTGGEFRAAVKYYARNASLTEKKHEAWTQAKQLRDAIDNIDRAMLDAQGITDQEERFAFFKARGEKLKAPYQGAEVIDVPAPIKEQLA